MTQDQHPITPHEDIKWNYQAMKLLFPEGQSDEMRNFNIKRIAGDEFKESYIEEILKIMKL